MYLILALFFLQLNFYSLTDWLMQLALVGRFFRVNGFRIRFTSLIFGNVTTTSFSVAPSLWHYMEPTQAYRQAV